jgi:RimJ/RimL family protein N-acetyltransferase
MSSEPVVALRPMTRADLRDVVRWRRQPHVAKWFDTGTVPTDAEIEGRYLPRITGDEPTRMFVVEANGRSVGMLQDYLISDHPEFAVLTPDPEAVGVDYLIGEPTWLGRGVGTGMLRRWFDVAHAGYPSAATCFAAPDHRNVASRRLLLRVGFSEGTWFDEPQRDGSVATLVGHSLVMASVLG